MILTNAYPYLPGEQFIDDEIGFWAEHAEAHVTLMPAVAHGVPRDIPAGMAIDTTFTSGRLLGRLVAVLAALFDRMFRNELAHLWRTRKLGWRTGLRALLHSSKVLQQAGQLMRYTEKNGDIDVAYCYWNDTQSYAAILAKARGRVRRVVSRVHGVDLYEPRRYREYMPLKRQFIRGYDRIFVLSLHAAAYMQATYGALPEKLELIPLGVPFDDLLSQPSPAGCVHVVSVSFCLPVKRLGRIVDGLAMFARDNPGVAVKWTHVGGGPLLEETRSLAQRKLDGITNLSFEFRGYVPHEHVRRVFLEVPVDVLVNTSESEGTPVSMMEAMSTGVPVVAPDVGGISYVVSDRCGALMSGSPDGREISKAIARVALGEERDDLRANARQVIEKRFDASRNYRDFVSNVLSMGAT
ncbi:glycosyltransferase [Dyella japonica]|uniref:glycosyltransferase n=1 Tax=Dyella japonica TaxID=231455 RepID=UPI00031E033A|nr:glycosyltransferase [Dyella japonica]